MKPPEKDAGQGRTPATLHKDTAKVSSVYRRLLACLGPQGWWPIVNRARGSGEYHLKAPRSGSDFFEIAVGAILTQNIAWKNVDTALATLKTRGLLEPRKLRAMGTARLAGLIRSTGYYNQKAKKIKNFIRWYAAYGYDWRMLKEKDTALVRNELLAVNGIGPETADSILLYALGKKVFVVDAYTVRIFTRLGVLSGGEKYHDIQELFHRFFRGQAPEYNEYHALIVAHGKDFCKKSPVCGPCCLAGQCAWRRLNRPGNNS